MLGWYGFCFRPRWWSATTSWRTCVVSSSVKQDSLACRPRKHGRSVLLYNFCLPRHLSPLHPPSSIFPRECLSAWLLSCFLFSFACFLSVLGSPITISGSSWDFFGAASQGFIGAFFSTLFFAVGLAIFLGQYDYFVCPVDKFSLFHSDGLTCKRNPVFEWTEMETPLWLQMVG